MFRWVLRLIPVLILMFTVVYYKLPGHPKSIEFFTALSVYFKGLFPESLPRFGIGILEILASLLILINKTARYGILLTVGLMAAAIFCHILLGWYDNLFVLAVIVLMCCLTYMATNRK